MLGAIIGDLAGSIYEYDQVKKVFSVNMNKIIEDNSFYSDDTILTICLIDAILNGGNYQEYLRKYILKYKDDLPNHKPYFETVFSPNTVKWAMGKQVGNSSGNGAVMRISPIGYLFNNESDVIKNAYLATIPSHNSKEAIECAKKIALMIYYFRNGLTKDEVYQKLNLELSYKPFVKFNTTCSETFNNCLYAIYYSENFEDAIRKTLLMGGDTDTNACIVGSVAEALYGIDDEIQKLALKKLPDEFQQILRKVC